MTNINRLGVLKGWLDDEFKRDCPAENYYFLAGINLCFMTQPFNQIS